LATLPQPSYSPDLAPADFFLFPRIKTPWKEPVLEPLKRSKPPSQRL
jgi:hypothetical protein